jgi:hypothetical protein
MIAAQKDSASAVQRPYHPLKGLAMVAQAITEDVTHEDQLLCRHGIAMFDLAGD